MPRNFEVADDGIIEFPRITAVMKIMMTRNGIFIMVLNLYGLFAHFVHPDDVFDVKKE